MIAALVLIAGIAGPVLRVPPAILADGEVAGGDPPLVWPVGTTLSVEGDGGEIVVRADRPIDDRAINRFRDAAGDAIGDLRWNDDSLVLRPAAGRTLRWRHSDNRMTIGFTPGDDAPVAAVAQDASDLDPQLLTIEADVAAGYPGEGRRRAETLATQHPADRRVIRILADARSADGDAAGATRLYRRLGATDRTARRAAAFAPGAASASVTLRDGSDLSQIESAARVDVALTDRTTIGGGVRHIASTIGDDHRGSTVAEAGATVRVGDEARMQAVLAGALDSGVTGGGVRYAAGSAEGQWRAGLTLHQPDYSTREQAIDDGWLSRVSAGATYRIAPGLVGQVDVGGNRYGIAGEGGAVDTITLAGGLDYIRRRGGFAFGLTYRMEAEYVQRLRGGIDFATRENHTVQGLVSGAIGEVQLTGLAGWTVDRFGGDGPNASLGLALPIGTAWRVEGSGGISSVTRPGFAGQQMFARAGVTRGLGNGR
ncbi:hypothetical protein ASE90_17540 [Sphingomonas sp. Leaf67]|uniref:hypothetical protein n=1 Tax=Sphingomonas sp. Leaf67 TaxID=1736230 RepID=UPI0006F661FF|nr:hypothetical protein [Sphingomonas sp. Leaf67]KQN90380.1 hypothetical protein ASE90_17540 [Sphingomonas sp. Leaf67]